MEENRCISEPLKVPEECKGLTVLNQIKSYDDPQHKVLFMKFHWVKNAGKATIPFSAIPKLSTVRLVNSVDTI